MKLKSSFLFWPLAFGVCAGLMTGCTGASSNQNAGAEKPVVLAAANSNAGGALATAQIPALTLPVGEGHVIDNYNNKDLYCGPFKDGQGTQFTLTAVPHQGKADDKFLFGDFNVPKGGHAGFWSKVGMNWEGKQDWSQATALNFMIYVSRPMTIRFNIKGDSDRKYDASTRIEEAKVWKKVEIPVSKWTNHQAGVGIVSDFDFHIEEEGAGQFALDEVRIVGGAATTQSGQKVELDPKVIFEKTLTPPKERSNKTYVVDGATGKDSNAGLAANPFKTIQKAADVVLPGDTVLIKNGVYDEKGALPTAGVNFTRSGAPDAWITFKAYPGHRPLITSKSWSTLRLEHVAYIEINGLELTTQKLEGQKDPNHNRNTGNGIGIGNAHHIRVLNCVVRDCGGGGIATGYSDYMHIEGNRVFRNGFWSIYNQSGISFFEVRDLDDKPGFHNIVRRNFCYENENKGPTPLFGSELTDGNGIIIDFHRGKAPILIENNICLNNGGRGIHVFHGKNVLVRNNTCVGNAQTLKGDSDLRANTSENIRFVNNIVVAPQNNKKFGDNHNPKNVSYERNLFFGYDKVSDEVGKDNIIGKDPKFVKISLEAKSANFALQSSSPAIDKGIAKDAATDDFSGKKRPLGKSVDIGAYEK